MAGLDLYQEWIWRWSADPQTSGTLVCVSTKGCLPWTTPCPLPIRSLNNDLAFEKQQYDQGHSG